MPEEYHIDEQQNVVWTRVWGHLTDADLLGQHARLKIDPNFRSHFNQLIDTCAVTDVSLSGKAVQQVATHSNFSPESKRAFVVQQDVIYGLSRMFELYQSIKGSRNVRVFRNREEAVIWLGVSDRREVTPVNEPKVI